MTLTETTGDLFDPKWGFDAVGHGVNLHGVMGAGIAKTISSRWPGIMAPYRTACRNGDLSIGGYQHYEDPDGTVIYNLASQSRPGRDARLLAVQSSVHAAVKDCAARGHQTLGLPQIGCGIGGLTWVGVRYILADIDSQNLGCDITVVKYEPA